MSRNIERIVRDMVRGGAVARYVEHYRRGGRRGRAAHRAARACVGIEWPTAPAAALDAIAAIAREMIVVLGRRRRAGRVAATDRDYLRWRW